MRTKNSAAYARPAGEYFDESGQRIYNRAQTGASLREYFAARAPDKIPGWFHLRPSPARPVLPTADMWLTPDDPNYQDDETLINGWLRDPCYDLPDHLKGFQNVFEKEVTKQREHDTNMERRRYFLWRWAYADGMCEAAGADLHFQGGGLHDVVNSVDSGSTGGE